MSSVGLEAVWGDLDPPPSGALTGRPPAGFSAASGVRLALDHARLRHLLLPVAAADTLPERSVTRGLEVTIDELQIGQETARRFFDVSCRDPTQNRTFAKVCEEILDEVAADPNRPRAVLARVLDRWRYFWATPPGALRDEEIIGLFGELWFLEYWLGPITAKTLATWRGPLRDRHDFQSPAASIEVKATRARADGAARHRITSLDQLEDPDQGRLYLFSLQVTPDPIATHSLAASVERISVALAPAPDELRTFRELLGRARYNPADRHRYVAPLRVTAEELYAVDRGFPRLTAHAFPTGIPGGVGDITYTLDLGACQPWRTATKPAEAASVRTAFG